MALDDLLDLCTPPAAEGGTQMVTRRQDKHGQHDEASSSSAVLGNKPPERSTFGAQQFPAPLGESRQLVMLPGDPEVQEQMPVPRSQATIPHVRRDGTQYAPRCEERDNPQRLTALRNAQHEAVEQEGNQAHEGAIMISAAHREQPLLEALLGRLIAPLEALWREQTHFLQAQRSSGQHIEVTVNQS